MIYLIYGEEFFLARRYTSTLIKESNIDNIINLDYEEDKIDRLYELENYCMKWDIKGKKWYEKKWNFEEEENFTKEQEQIITPLLELKQNYKELSKSELKFIDSKHLKKNYLKVINKKEIN